MATVETCDSPHAEKLTFLKERVSYVGAVVDTTFCVGRKTFVLAFVACDEVLASKKQTVVINPLVMGPLVSGG